MSIFNVHTNQRDLKVLASNLSEALGKVPLQEGEVVESIAKSEEGLGDIIV